MTDRLLEDMVTRALARQTASQERLPSMDWFSSNVLPDYAIRKSLQLLHDSGAVTSDMPTVRTRPQAPSTGRITQGFVRRNDPTVYLNPNAPVFRQATKRHAGALQELAALLAHERHHVLHPEQIGVEEFPAYDEQLRVLKLLGADQKALNRVLIARRTRQR